MQCLRHPPDIYSDGRQRDAESGRRREGARGKHGADTCIKPDIHLEEGAKGVERRECVRRRLTEQSKHRLQQVATKHTNGPGQMQHFIGLLPFCGVKGLIWQQLYQLSSRL